MTPTRDVLDPRDPARAAELRAWLDLQQALAFAPGRAIAALEQTADPRRALRLEGLVPSPPARLDRRVQWLGERG
ncbi:MAG: hypothetical protein ACR2P8_16415, partial [Myxococcota bacterium]